MSAATPNQAQAIYQAVDAVLSGNHKAYAVIVDAYLRLVYNYIYRMVQNVSTAEELTQEVFIRVFEKLDTFDHDRPFQPWLMRITANLTLSYLRKQSSESRLVELDDVHEVSLNGKRHYPDAAAQVEQKLTETALLQALAQVEDKYRTVLLLRYHYECPYKEIADMLDTPVNTLKTWFRRGKDQLKSILEASDADLLTTVS